MSSGFSQAINHVAELVTESGSWTPNEVMITVATSLVDDTPIQVNLIDTMGHKARNSKDNRNVYWLQQQFSVNTDEFRAKVLSPHFVLPCREQGFTIMQKGWEPTRNFTVFVCQRGRYSDFNDGSTSGSQNNTSSRISTILQQYRSLVATQGVMFQRTGINISKLLFTKLNEVHAAMLKQARYIVDWVTGVARQAYPSGDSGKSIVVPEWWLG